MIVDDTLGRAVEAGSRDHLLTARVIASPGGTPVETLRVRGGELRARARPGDRWSGRVELAGGSRVPVDETDPLAGLTGALVRVELGATVDTVPTYVNAAELLVVGTQVRRSARDYAVTVELGSLASYVDAAAPRDWTPQASESVAAMIYRVVNDSRPPSWPPVTVANSSSGGSTLVPADYAAQARTGWSVVLDLCTIGNVTAYVDRWQQLVIRDPLDDTAAVVRQLGPDTVLTAYTLDVGRRGFANRVELRCSPVQAVGGDPVDDVVGVAEQVGGPLGSATVGRVIRDERALTGTIGQGAANARALALLRPFLRGWLTTQIEAVPDPRLDPDDDIRVTYVGGDATVHRITELSLDLGTGPMRLACRTIVEAPLASTVTPGQPGTFGPAGTRPPATLAELATIDAGAEWTTEGDYVTVGGVDYWWDGTTWQTGRVPAPPHLLQGRWRMTGILSTSNNAGYVWMPSPPESLRCNYTDMDGVDHETALRSVQVGDVITVTWDLLPRVRTVTSVTPESSRLDLDVSSALAASRPSNETIITITVARP